MILIASYFIWMTNIGIEYLAFTELLTYFSPHTYADVFAVYLICELSVVLPFILHRNYNGMEIKLTKFAQIYNQCLRGIIWKGK